jgi:hypothetical protein
MRRALAILIQELPSTSLDDRREVHPRFLSLLGVLFPGWSREVEPRTGPHIGHCHHGYYRFDVCDVHRPQSARPDERRQQGQHHHPHRDVKRMEPHQGVKGGAKEIRADGQPMIDDEPVPLPRCAGEEDAAQQGRQW